jgi:large subunit ribosomal protein L28
MSRKCDVCGKGTVAGNQISHAHNKTKRVFRPNLINIRAKVGTKTEKVKICAKCLKAGKVQKAV